MKRVAPAVMGIAVVMVAALALWRCAMGGTTELPAKEITQAAASCEQSPFGPGEYTRMIQSGGRKRFYRIHVPPSYTKGKAAPLVLNFHGGFGNSANQEEISKMNPVSDANGFIVVYPDGTGPLEHRFLSFNAGMCCGYAKSHNINEAAFVREMLDDVGRNFCIEPKRVFSTGFSNGAMMTHRLGCELSDRIAAIAPVSGPMPVDSCHPSRPVPVLEFHGTADPYAPYNGGLQKAIIGREKQLYRSVNETISGWVERDHATGSVETTFKKGAVTCVTHDAGPDGAPVTLCTIEGAGHTWPGGVSTLSERKVGPVNHDISASQMIWEFFAKHPMS
jgi:polyhydroxybutyrate depolymerase